ncbi:MAG TPA: hypothetical protein VF747_08015, partial [Blastocatellia bacterium]
MFIPRGTALHENLATSYVLIDALVADLCEGGFSGIVNILLRNTDAHIIIVRGNVAAVIERRNASNPNGEPMAIPHSRTTVAEIASLARSERGRVSIYSYSTEAANVIAGRINAEPLYTQLSTEFADLEKMISKLARERDRQWFVEINTTSHIAALIHLKGDQARILLAQDGATVDEYETTNLIGCPELRRLLDESNRVGGAFDVYFKGASDPLESFDVQQAEPAEPESPAPTETTAPPGDSPTGAVDDLSQAVKDAKAAYRSLMLDDSRQARSRAEEASGGEISQGFDPGSQAGLPADDLSFVQDEFSKTGGLSLTGEAVRMAEIKRLMAEIARAIEEATQAVEQRDRFAMYLRAGQLKVADRYPFLDPFGAEFEYLAGEIVFVGEASADDFVAGLTEALTRAVQGVTESSSQAARLRAR